MTGAFAVGLVACVGATLWVNSQLFITTEKVELSGESVDRRTGQFSSIESTGSDIKYYSFRNDNSQYAVMDLYSIIRIVENESITEPIVTTYPALENIISVTADGDVLRIAFHPDSIPSRKGEYITYVNTIDTPVTVTVPRGMLKSINGNSDTRFYLDGFDADSLRFDCDRKVIIDNSKIGLLQGSISGALVIRNNSDIAECRLTVQGDDFRMKSENDSRFGIVQLIDCDPDMKLDISEATIGEVISN